MPRVIRFPPAEDARDAQAWSAFAAEDAAVRVPPALEARVLRAAQAALAAKRQTAIDRRRRAWLGAIAAVAASAVAASGWYLSRRPAPPPAPVAAPASAEPAAEFVRTVGRRVPMTNVEAGRVLTGVPHAALAARPLVDALGLVRMHVVPRSTSFAAAPIGHNTTGARFAEAGAPAAPLPATPLPVPVAVNPAVAEASPGSRPVLDPDAAPDPKDPAYRAEQANPAPAPAPAPPQNH